MNNGEIKRYIERCASGMTKKEDEDLFDLVVGKPDDDCNELWADNILAASDVVGKIVNKERAIEYLVTAYDEFKTNYPNAFENKVNILRKTCNLQVEGKKLRDAHKTMNRYLYNALAQVKFALSYPKMHYFSFRGITDYSIGEIEKEQITLAHPREFNDPLDTILVWWLDNEIKSGCKNERELNFRLLMKKASEHIKMRCLIGSKYKEGTDWKERKVEDLSALMWAHYAKGHTGLCVEYDFCKDMFKKGTTTDEEELVMIAPMEYTHAIDVSTGEPSMREALFKKSYFWEYENEMRLCSFNVNNKEEFPHIDCKDAIKAVYLGVKCKDTDRRKVENAIGDKDIPLYKMAVDDKKMTQFKKIQIG